MILRNPYIICSHTDSRSVYDKDIMVRKYIAIIDKEIYNRIYFYFYYKPGILDNAIVYDFKFVFDFEKNHKRYTGVPFKHKSDSLNSVTFFNPVTNEQIILKDLIITDYSLGHSISFNYYYKDIYSKILKLDKFLNNACVWNNKNIPIIIALDYEEIK